MHELQLRRYIEVSCGAIGDSRSWLDWLSPHVTSASRVAHFGCSNGPQTIALAWFLGTTEVVGLDIDEAKVAQAREQLDGLRSALRETGQFIRHYPDAVSEEDKLWWTTSIPAFFKDDLLARNRHIEFEVHDMTRSVPLTEEYYDLSFADFVLHHIWFDEGGPEVCELTLSAAREMARITREGGCISVRELSQTGDRRPLDFHGLFSRFPLELIYHQTDLLPEGTVERLIYRKHALSLPQES